MPVCTSVDGKWSMLDRKGDIVYNSQFQSEPTAVIGGVYGVRDANGITLYSAADVTPKPIEGCSNLVCAGVCNDGLIPIVKPGQRISVVDSKGKKQFELSPVDGKEIVQSQVHFHDGMLVICDQDGKYGYVDAKGNPVIKPKYLSAYAYSNGKALVKVLDETTNIAHWEIIDKSGNTITKLEDTDEPIVNFAYYYGRLLFKQKGKDISDRDMFFLNTKGDKSEIPDIVYITNWNNLGYTYIDSKNKVGVKNFSYDEIIAPQYKGIVALHDKKGFVAQTFVGSFILLDNKGNEKKTLTDCSEVYVINNDFIFVLNQKKDKLYLVDSDINAKGKQEFYVFGTKMSQSEEIMSDYK